MGGAGRSDGGDRGVGAAGADRVRRPPGGGGGHRAVHQLDGKSGRRLDGSGHRRRAGGRVPRGDRDRRAARPLHRRAPAGGRAGVGGRCRRGGPRRRRAVRAGRRLPAIRQPASHHRPGGFGGGRRRRPLRHRRRRLAGSVRPAGPRGAGAVDARDAGRHARRDPAGGFGGRPVRIVRGDGSVRGGSIVGRNRVDREACGVPVAAGLARPRRRSDGARGRALRAGPGGRGAAGRGRCGGGRRFPGRRCRGARVPHRWTAGRRLRPR